MGDYFGYPTVELSNPSLKLECLQTAGPRIVRLTYKESGNLLGEVPHNVHPTPYGEYRFLGGHRLWHAPEANPRSYIPDLNGLTLTENPGGVSLAGQSETATGISKRIDISLDPVQPVVMLKHTLFNNGPWEVELAPWAITMLRLGGTLLFPVHGGYPGKDNLLPNRHFALWPYSHFDDPRLTLTDDFILIQADPGLPAFKIGAWNPQGWLAYWLDGVLFRKSFDAQNGRKYPDFDCNAESYCDSHVIELESLGPLSRLSPGESVTHMETWQVYESIDQDFIPENLLEQISKKPSGK